MTPAYLLDKLNMGGKKVTTGNNAIAEAFCTPLYSVLDSFVRTMLVDNYATFANFR